MFTSAHPRKPAWALARARVGVRLCVRADAFGNALGNSIAEGLSKPSQQENKVSQVNLNRAQEERLQSGQTVTDYGDGYAEGPGDTASSVGAQRRAGGAAGEVAALTIDQVAAMNPDGSRAAGAGRGFVNPPTVGEMESMRENGRSTGILNSNATDPFERYDLNSQEGRHLFFGQTKTDFDAGTLGAQQASTAKAMLFHYYGYSMGENLGSSTAALEGSLQSAGSTDAALGRALAGYSGNDVATNRERYDLYSNIQVVYDNGVATRGRTVDVVRDDGASCRRVTLNWTQNFSNVAGEVGVSADEALRKTDFDVIKASINTAFATDGVRSFNINGAWCPHPADYKAILGKTSPLTNPTSEHISSRALDINAINGVPVNNGGYVNHAPRLTEPNIVERFTDNLLNQNGVTQIFQPWRMWANTSKDSVANSDVKRNQTGQITGPNANATLHKDHLHFGF
jgi:hypothetical protein